MPYQKHRQALEMVQKGTWYSFCAWIVGNCSDSVKGLYLIRSTDEDNPARLYSEEWKQSTLVHAVADFANDFEDTVKSARHRDQGCH